MPKVSVILTSYNHEKYISQAIESVLEQTFADFELIIADDCSSDSSWDIIQSYSDPRIKARRSSTNMRTKNFYDAVHSACGEYIAVHHSDDVWLPEKLAKQVQHLNAHPEHVAVFTQGCFIDEDGVILKDSSWLHQPNRSRHRWLRDFFFCGNLLCHPTVLMRQEQVGKIYSVYGATGYNDWRAWVQTCLTDEIFVLQEELFYFRWMTRTCSNDGGWNARNRFEMDLPWVLENYLLIESIEDWKRIFPESDKFIIEGQFVAEYFFAKLCLEQTSRPARQYFALNLLMRTLNNPSKRELMDKIYGFNAAAMAKLATQHDPFGLELRERVQTLENELAQTKSKFSELEAVLVSVLNSRSWRVTHPLRAVRHFFSDMKLLFGHTSQRK